MSCSLKWSNVCHENNDFVPDCHWWWLEFERIMLLKVLNVILLERLPEAVILSFCIAIHFFFFFVNLRVVVFSFQRLFFFIITPLVDYYRSYYLHNLQLRLQKKQTVFLSISCLHSNELKSLFGTQTCKRLSQFILSSFVLPNLLPLLFNVKN